MLLRSLFFWLYSFAFGVVQMLVQLKHVVLGQDFASHNFVVNISLNIKIHEPLVSTSLLHRLIFQFVYFVSQLLLFLFKGALDQIIMFIRNDWVDELQVVADFGFVDFSTQLLLDSQFLLFLSRRIFLILLLLSLFISPSNTFLLFFNLALNVGKLSHLLIVVIIWFLTSRRCNVFL